MTYGGKQLFTNVRLATMADATGYGEIADGAVLVDGDTILWTGPAGEAPECGEVADCGGRVMTPGLIDCHTHLVYGGNRANEFEMRLNGASYQEIAQAGGGIVSTVKATREASQSDLQLQAQPRLAALMAEGVTTVEIKSGYGLDVETEAKMLRTARRLGEANPVDVVTSFLGAHTIPAEYTDDRAGYVRLICEQALPAIAEAGLADAVDGFSEGIALSVAEVEEVFVVAGKHGLPVKLHAEQLSNLGGAAMAARHGALSVDHVEYLDDAGVAAIAASGTVAVLLPGAFYYLRETQRPPVDALRAANVPIAVATDLNPGSSPVHSILSTLNMACVLFALTPAEALAGVTRNAARALGLSDRGVVAPGMKADLAIWDIDSPGELAYPLGFNPLAGLYRRGVWVRALA
jgi:imidazolonepropionase